ncbi:filament integrity protein FraC [Lyngbya aestuarii]|uniref:filament integrity protein FraC n=1 Tax=Lyngbya aestuarii TaxID=118322 RepID=UPI00403D8BCD
MPESVLPMPIILWQVVLLLVAIALEAIVMYRRLGISRRTSVQYAISINLIWSVVGWLVCFLLFYLLSPELKTQLISFIFFGHTLDFPRENLGLIIASIGIVIFFAAFLIKLKGLELLEAFLQSSQDSADSGNRPRLTDRLNRAIVYTDANEAMVVFLANAYSCSAILVLMFLRYLMIDVQG